MSVGRTPITVSRGFAKALFIWVVKVLICKANPDTIFAPPAILAIP